MSLGIYVGFALISFYSTPFINPSNDFMDASGRICGCVTVIAALVVVLEDR